MKDKLLIIGASGHGRVVSDVALKMNKWKNIAFLDDGIINVTHGLEVIGKSIEAEYYIEDYDIFVAIGTNAVRERFLERLEALNASIPALVHPSASIGTRVDIKPGTVIMANAVINSFTNIGKGCIINTGATIDHDNVIHDYVHISPGANVAGTVEIGKGTWIGVGSAVSNNVNITSGCKIGAGTVVIKDITEIGTYVGVPARRV